MSYYFCIVGTRDNPIYQADLVSKPTTSSGAASFFSSSSSTATSNTAATPGTSTYDQRGSLESTQSSLTGTGIASSGGSVFGFGNALGALTGGLSAAREARNVYGSNAGASSSSGEGKGLGFGRYNDKDVLQMIAHSSLDVVEDKQFVNNAMYLKAVDRINEWTTSAYITPGNLKFLILHEHKHDDGIRNFFFDVWELVVKVLLNPFHDLNDPITSPAFDTKVKASARKHL